MVTGTTAGPASQSCLEHGQTSMSCHRKEKSLDPIIVLTPLNKSRKATSRYWRHILVKFGENYHWQFSATREIVFLTVSHNFISLLAIFF